MEDELIDRIYECSVVPELWPAVLDDLATLTESRGGILFSARRSLFWTASGSVRDVFEAYVNDGWFMRCPRRTCLMSKSDPSFFVEQDFWSDDEIEVDPIYRDFFRPRGLGWSAGTGLQMPTGDNIVFSVERDLERGPVEPEHVAALNRLRPHLARSALVSARLGLQRGRGATEALAELRLPALLLNEAGVVIEANSWAQDLPDQFKFGAHDRLVVADKSAQELLAANLKLMGNSSAAGRASFPLRDEFGTATLVLHLIPISRSAHDIFGPSFALLLATPVSSERAPSVDLMRSLFDMTPAEARVGQAMARGQTLEDVATDHGVSINTVRNQLRAVLEKTGCARQAELAALMANLAVAPSA
ncbi:helix-turn-helix transcriptional regulator [Phenylobacterium sp.]|uniref:helix-turn-helix transcriptional regulator n=1 Tax=Phenylobacterium sp. TaxID=1871053 RepID=UPI0030F4A762